MKRNNLRLLFLVIGFSLFTAVWSQSFSAERPPFYQGKTLTFLINFAAGGPTDIESRIFAKHLTKHIPGQPAVVVQAMGGGGGLTAVNYTVKLQNLTGSLWLILPEVSSNTRLRIPLCASISVNLDSSRVYRVSRFSISAPILRRG
jgi:tripartite-type tricarboxylate transporter receptor subunit TctC